jgi:hypothetical protein
MLPTSANARHSIKVVALPCHVDKHPRSRSYNIIVLCCHVSRSGRSRCSPYRYPDHLLYNISPVEE